MHKYAGKTGEQMVKEQEAIKTEYAQRSQEMETEITNFSKKTDEIKNPETGKVMALVKRPTRAMWKQLVPEELQKYRDVLKSPKDVDKIPRDVVEKYEDLVYTAMEQLIIQPKHTAKEWKEIIEESGDEFVYLFNQHLNSVVERMQERVGSFLPQT